MDEKIRRIIEAFVREYKIKLETKTSWHEPLVAFADAKDPLFKKLKSVIAPSHNTPNELLKDAKTVVSYFIPFERRIALSNVRGKSSSREWAIAYIETNRLIGDLNEHLSKRLKDLNFRSTILPATHNFDRETLISNWSHKHAAFIAGLGGFGLHRMFITERGCCGRLGSFITNAKARPTKRSNKEFCLYNYDGSCKICVEKCIFGALTNESFDKHKCHSICAANSKLHSSIGLADTCGKCVCVVPCSFENPVEAPAI
ncbi:MAG: epoxyqueuosine reductase [Candidatus Hodarchaeota archaeon]